MEDLKEILGIASVILVSMLVLRLVIKGIHKGRQLLNKQKAERKALEAFDKFKAGKLHPGQSKGREYRLPSMEKVENTGDMYPTLKPKEILEKLKERKAKQLEQDSKWVKVSDTPKWKDAEEMRLDGTDYSADQIILGASDYMSDPYPSPSHSSYDGNGHGGDFGGGGASGSWDSGSDSSSSYDSGSSDSGSSWSD